MSLISIEDHNVVVVDELSASNGVSMKDIRAIYNAVVVLADVGQVDLAQEVFDLAEKQPVPTEISGGTRLAQLAAEDAIDTAITKTKGENHDLHN